MNLMPYSAVGVTVPRAAGWPTRFAAVLLLSSGGLTENEVLERPDEVDEQQKHSSEFFFVSGTILISVVAFPIMYYANAVEQSASASRILRATRILAPGKAQLDTVSACGCTDSGTDADV